MMLAFNFTQFITIESGLMYKKYCIFQKKVFYCIKADKKEKEEKFNFTLILHITPGLLDLK